MMKMKLHMLPKKKTSSLAALAVLSLSLILLLAPRPLAAQTIGGQTNVQNGPVNRGPIERVATGKIVNKDGSPIGGAVAYLKDSRTDSVKTYIADQNGNFRFGNLSQNTDYELWAESNGVRSKSRQISSFDNESKFYFVFKLNVVKAVSLDGPSISDTGINPQP
ncbi:MAG: carboxypeptidase-like regulatory domain-containing protein [Acidobacteriaceae bacterium]